MKHIKKITAIIVLFIVVLFTVAKAQPGTAAIEHITIISTDFQTTYNFPLTSERLLEMCRSNNPYNSCGIVPVRNEKLIQLMSQRIDTLTDKDTLASEYSGLDARVVCLLRRKNGARVDTVSFGGNMGLNPPAMKVNSNYYTLDKELLRTIAEYVPEVHRADILRYVDVIVPKYEEMLDNYYREHPDEPDRRKR